MTAFACPGPHVHEDGDADHRYCNPTADEGMSCFCGRFTLAGASAPQSCGDPSCRPSVSRYSGAVSAAAGQVSPLSACNHGYVECAPSLHADCRHCGQPIKQTVGRLDIVAHGPQRGPWLHYNAETTWLACLRHAEPPAVLDSCFRYPCPDAAAVLDIYAPEGNR